MTKGIPALLRRTVTRSIRPGSIAAHGFSYLLYEYSCAGVMRACGHRNGETTTVFRSQLTSSPPASVATSQDHLPSSYPKIIGVLGLAPVNYPTHRTTHPNKKGLPSMKRTDGYSQGTARAATSRPYSRFTSSIDERISLGSAMHAREILWQTLRLVEEKRHYEALHRAATELQHAWIRRLARWQTDNISYLLR